MKYKRILLKLSGEALMGEKQFGIDNNRLIQYAEEIKQIADLGVDAENRVQLIGVELPPERKAGIKVDDVAQLVDKLKNEAKVI